MLKVAFACLAERIAPVFDTALQICVLEVDSGRVVSEKMETLPPDLPLQKTIRLNDLGIHTIVCGAISRTLNAMIVANGIQVIPFVAGDVRAVIHAWLSGGLRGNAFAMPGCCGRARFKNGGFFAENTEVKNMNGKGQGGMGGGRGQGGGQGRGRMGGPKAAGASGTCVCPKCAERVAHERGVPCVQRQCPKCGTALIRE